MRLVVFHVCDCWEKKNIYEHKHLYNKIPLECEARQCYDADYDDSLSPLTFSGEWSEDSCLKKIKNQITMHWLHPPPPPPPPLTLLISSYVYYLPV